ncbi:ABC-F family ATP-binding cassette domain-containing protein [Candidatus Uhrbacteria bacterium]|jgi:ATP-binding cassette, subfamily F, member 3|nr:ABC-F family ATP-binding cassette domain-containing protein [Candidatus Uhrbacteria bacterium]
MPHPLVEGRKLRKAYGLQVVLDDLSFLVSEKQKIALIGRNGAGKSTLIKILTGAEQADGGESQFYPLARVGIVEQHAVLPEDVTTLEFLEQKEDKPEWEIRKLAATFGLHADHLAKPPAHLSGGYQMRIKLVAMLLTDPNFLILDEPVNYLDLQTLILLERFLQNYRGAFLLAAHDRTFLQNTCTHTFEIERGKLTSYKGSVQEYLEFKQEQLDFEIRHNKKLSKQIAHQQKFVDRFRFKASLASRAQSKVKHIAKLRTKVAAINTALATTKITIPSPHFVAGTALHTDDLKIGYGDFEVASKIDFEIVRGEKVVIAGENGRGKSTLLKTIAGRIPSLGGTFKWWHRANIGYYDQKTEATLKSTDTVLKYLTRMAPIDASSERLLMMAGNFLFRNDDLDKSVSVLSGGERARLCLAGVLLHEHNVLLLDEPTNHLDVETTEALALALKEYKGTVIVISHARTFINTLVDKVFEIRSGSLRRHMGSYVDYVDDLVELMEASVVEQLDGTQSTSSSLSTDQRSEIHTRVKEHQRSQQRIDKQVTKLDKEKSEILAYFFENPTDYAPAKATRLAELNTLLDDLEKDWLNDQEGIDQLRDELDG